MGEIFSESEMTPGKQRALQVAERLRAIHATVKIEQIDDENNQGPVPTYADQGAL